MDPQQTPTEPQATPPVTPPPAPQPDQSAQYWQGQADKTAHENQQLRAQLEQMRQAQSTPPPPAPATPPAQPTQLNYGDINAWRADDGSMRPEYADVVFGEGVPDNVKKDLWTTVNQAQQIVSNHANQAVATIFGDQQSYQTAAAKAAESLPAHERDALNDALGNPFLMQDALTKLKGMADEGGWLQQPDQQQQTPEPPAVGQHQSQATGAMTPLVPGSAEAQEAMKHPDYMKRGPEGDAYRKQLDHRLALGMQQNQGSWGKF